MKLLVFNNADAKPKTVRILCDAESVRPIMAWYGAYHAGDRYTVAVDGRNVRMDINGEPEAPDACKEAESFELCPPPAFRL